MTKLPSLRPVLVILLLLAAIVRAAPPAEPGPVIEAGRNDGEWRWLFSALAAKGAMMSTFTEERWFSMRKTPTVLQGEMRLLPGRGLSLHYTEPEEQLLVVDDAGLLMRDAKGRTREIKTEARAAGLSAALLPVMQFDLEKLREDFYLHAARDGNDWRLDFVPRDRELARTLGSLVVTGIGTTVRRLEFRHSARQRIVVIIKTADTGVTFSEEDARRFFR
ncbi:outer membrane lipoprotein carrier protein LolA [Termitidicoccus mucosus]|uniref:Outer membrane lipoprotein carrier protein LolA n=1 Tax=Termitidicoccus mucosus TaxID=1184151 RepID=A0A178IGS5_9BACT|nr:hypothetical protein AW736_14180 [Opitutaceae bacterium TSB47]